MTDAVLLSLRSFGVAFGDRIVLSDVSLDVPRLGILNLVGPAGSGKSTLLRTLSGLNAAHPALSTWGEARLDGASLGTRPSVLPGEVRRGVGFVVQHARFFLDSVRENLVSALPNRAFLDRATQTRMVTALLQSNGLSALSRKLDDDVASLSTSLQRRLAIVRALPSDPTLLFADEPTAGLDDDDALEVLCLLRVQAHFRAVVFVTHNQRWARAVGGTTALLAGGRIREVSPTRTFFDAPATPFGQAFVRTGRCRESEVDTEGDGDGSEESQPASPARPARSRFEGPRGFFWLWPGQLGGLPRPGIVDALEHDIEGLERLGVTTLVTLEERRTVDPAALESVGIFSLHFPIVDMGVPDQGEAERLGFRVHQLVAQGGVVAMHCRAGLGRTGTMLAAQLLFEGEGARAAIERIRRLDPRCIQSDEQIEFLSSYETFLRQGRKAFGAFAPT